MSDQKIKLELGGGSKPRAGFVNVDLCHGADIQFDLEALRRFRPEQGKLGCPDVYEKITLPIADDSVSEVYTSHCLEHVQNLDGVLWELSRVCHNGATIEIHVPHYLHPDAMCPAHKHTIGVNTVKGWGKRVFCGKTFDLSGWDFIPDPVVFDEARELHPGWKDDQILRFVPGACFEVRYFLRVRRVS